jgi:hypothetical protein
MGSQIPVCHHLQLPQRSKGTSGKEGIGLKRDLRKVPLLEEEDIKASK